MELLCCSYSIQVPIHVVGSDDTSNPPAASEEHYEGKQ